jgi:predicted nucleic acid-binding protein
VIVVLDASVILKWLLQDPEREPDTERATALIEAVIRGEIEVIEPVHWLPEVASVLARLAPETALDDVAMLSAMQLPTSDEPQVTSRAVTLAINTGAHLFDTLYHAVALEHADATLITADVRYYDKAHKNSRVLLIGDWTPAATNN